MCGNHLCRIPQPPATMLFLLLRILACLAFVRVGAHALVLPTITVILPPIPTTAPFPTTSLAATDPSSLTCDHIHICRTLLGIVWSCLGTIFACVWVAVHRNIPGPQKTSHLGWLRVVIVTLLAPEWILAWAVRQRFGAWSLSVELENARVLANEKRGKRNTTSAGMSAENEGQAAGEFVLVARKGADDVQPTPTNTNTAGAVSSTAPDTCESTHTNI